MHRKKAITPFGWEIKRRLAELEMDQKTFCELHDIPPSRLSNLINGSRKAARYRKQVSELLGLSASGVHPDSRSGQEHIQDTEAVGAGR